MPILEAIFIGTTAFSALMGLEHSTKKKTLKKTTKRKKTIKKAPKKKNYVKKKSPKKKKSPVKKKKSPVKKKKSPVKKKPLGKRWETKLELRKQLTQCGYKFTNAQLDKENITDLRILLKSISGNI